MIVDHKVSLKWDKYCKKIEILILDFQNVIHKENKREVIPKVKSLQFLLNSFRSIRLRKSEKDKRVLKLNHKFQLWNKVVKQDPI